MRALNRIGYKGPLSIEWEDSGMNREHGAKEACEFVKRVNFKPSVEAAAARPADAFEAAVSDLARFHARWPLQLRALVTARHPPEAAIDLLVKPVSGIKTVVSFERRS